MKIAVYTFISGRYDNLKPFDKNFNKEADFYYFTDNPQETLAGSGKYKPVIIPIIKGYERYTARYCKILSHLFLPDYDYTIWIDGSTSLQASPREIIKKYLTTFEVAAFRYPDDDCIYSHAEKCVAAKRFSIVDIAPQMEYFRTDGFPEHAGLCEMRVVLRKHTPQIKALNNFWFKTYNKWITCDQLCFNYCTWKLGIQYDVVAWGSPEFKIGLHVHPTHHEYIRQ
jgi:hypothetical protein